MRARVSSRFFLLPFLFLALRDHADVAATTAPFPPSPPSAFSIPVVNSASAPGGLYLPDSPNGCQYAKFPNRGEYTTFRMYNAYICTWEGTLDTGQLISQITLVTQTDGTVDPIDAYEYMAVSVNDVEVLRSPHVCQVPIVIDPVSGPRCPREGKDKYFRYVLDSPVTNPKITLRASARRWPGVTHMLLKEFYLWFIASPPPTPPPSPPPLSCERVASATLPANPLSHFTMRTPPLLSESGTGTWADVSGTGTAAATLTGSGFAIVGETGMHGAQGFASSLQGTTASQISFGDVIKEPFTICSVTRYTGTANSDRILQGGSNVWLHGHWNGRLGVAYYTGWRTQYIISQVNPTTDWLLMCGTNVGQKIANFKDVTTNAGGVTTNGLWINGGFQAGYWDSDFAVAEIVTWDRALAQSELFDAMDFLYGANLCGTYAPPPGGPPSLPPSPPPPASPPPSPPPPSPPPPSTPPPSTPPPSPPPPSPPPPNPPLPSPPPPSPPPPSPPPPSPPPPGPPPPSPPPPSPPPPSPPPPSPPPVPPPPSQPPPSPPPPTPPSPSPPPPSPPPPSYPPAAPLPPFAPWSGPCYQCNVVQTDIINNLGTEVCVPGDPSSTYEDATGNTVSQQEGECYTTTSPARLCLNNFAQ